MARVFRTRDRDKIEKFLFMLEQKYAETTSGQSEKGAGSTTATTMRGQGTKSVLRVLRGEGVTEGKTDHLEGPWWLTAEVLPTSGDESDEENEEKAIRLAIEPVTGEKEDEEEGGVGVVATITENPSGQTGQHGHGGIPNFFWKARDAKRPHVGPVLGPAIKDIKDKDLTPLPAKVEFVQFCRKMDASPRRREAGDLLNSLQVIYAEDGTMLTRGKLDVNLPLVDAYCIADRLIQPPNTGNCVGTPTNYFGTGTGTPSIGTPSQCVDTPLQCIGTPLQRVGTASPDGETKKMTMTPSRTSTAKTVKFRESKDGEISTQVLNQPGSDAAAAAQTATAAASTTEIRAASSVRKSGIRRTEAQSAKSSKSVTFRDKNVTKEDALLTDGKTVDKLTGEPREGATGGFDAEGKPLKQKTADIKAWLQEVEETASTNTGTSTLSRTRCHTTTGSSPDYDSVPTDDENSSGTYFKAVPRQHRRGDPISLPPLLDSISTRKRFPPYNPPTQKTQGFLKELSVEGEFSRNFEERISQKMGSIADVGPSSETSSALYPPPRAPPNDGHRAAVSGRMATAASRPTPGSSNLPHHRGDRPASLHPASALLTSAFEPLQPPTLSTGATTGVTTGVADILVFDTKRCLKPNVETLSLKMQMHDAARGKVFRPKRLGINQNKVFGR